MNKAARFDEIDTRVFRDAMSLFATGVAVVTCTGPQGAVGITVNSFASLSLDPPLVLWSIDAQSKRRQAFETATHTAVHILGADQTDICAGFVKDAGFHQHCETDVHEAGLPLIKGCIARMECVPHATVDGGDHRIFLLRVQNIETQSGAPLVFQNKAFRQLSDIPHTNG